MKDRMYVAHDTSDIIFSGKYVNNELIIVKAELNNYNTVWDETETQRSQAFKRWQFLEL